MHTFDVSGIGNALVDILCHVDESEFAKSGIEVESYNLVSEAEIGIIRNQFESVVMARRSGGSVANSMALAATLGSKTAFVGQVGNDIDGKFFADDIGNVGTRTYLHQVPTGTTGTVLVMVTPDGKRTMRGCLGCAGSLSQLPLAKDWAATKWFFVEGYLIVNGPHTVQVLLESVKLARNAGAKIAFTLSDAFVVGAARQVIESLRPHVDLLFCNETEALALTETTSRDAATRVLRERWKCSIVTLAEDGVILCDSDTATQVSTVPVRPVDLTGAGDAFSGAVLHALAKGASLKEAAQLGNRLAREAIQVIGARVPEQTIHEVVASYNG